MGVTNLSLIFAPLFFRAKVEEIKKMMRESPIVNMLTETLITNKDDLFKVPLIVLLSACSYVLGGTVT